MKRSYYSKSVNELLTEPLEGILGELASNNEFSLDVTQRNAWIQEIQILKEQLYFCTEGHILFEYSIPRIGKRVDNILIFNGVIYVIEFKVGYDTKHGKSGIDQVFDYALDLKNFHGESHDKVIVPLLVSTMSMEVVNKFIKGSDSVFNPLLANKNNLGEIIFQTNNLINIDCQINPTLWENGVYKPTPNIIEAAQALYQGHDVKEISRSDSGAINLSLTSNKVNQIIDKAKENKEKIICFITGVPGAGKTLAGLNIANSRHNFKEEEHAIFLSGNGPLVTVLREALARYQVENNPGTLKKRALSEAEAFIQNIHHFRDEALKDSRAPIEKVVVFDEAQRAWNKEQTSNFMKTKRRLDNFDMSESQFLISVMDRHKDWAVIVCLIGGGQEINTGEAGLPEWFRSLQLYFSNWKVFVSDQITENEYLRNYSLNEITKGLDYTVDKDLHLSVSVRSFRSEKLSFVIKSLLDLDIDNARRLYKLIQANYPIVITRDLIKAKDWLVKKARGSERIGITASSGGLRLKPYGLWVKNSINPAYWFLNKKEDVRSSNFLEDVATEFDVQGLELDWTCLAWDADLRIDNGGWSYNNFSGTGWKKIHQEDKKLYLLNAYRVLLTRARQGMVIYVPEGDKSDYTRPSSYYDETFI
ncbi:DUF2075 domain-containing protein, partial [Neobacillus drentensis]|uniref:DUF2075 domain-containing protein n=1 Tax=Neobacillus drentensis TaxID=220684 RepID=UPI002FFEC9D6